MKILILANDDHGLFTFRKELINNLMKNSEVYISVPFGNYIENLERIGAKCINTTISRHGKNPIKDLKLLNFYKKIIKSINPDVVLTYTIKPNVYGGIVCSRLKVKYISNITGLGNSIENSGILQKISLYLYKKGLKKASHVFFQNEENMDFMIKRGTINKEIASIIPGSGVNLIENRYENYPDDNETISFVTIGRIIKEKGIDELLEAIEILKNQHSNLSFKIIGSIGEDYREKINQACKKGLVEYLGFKSNIHDIIKNSFATIHPSYHEGTSNVLLETAACGRPIVASNVPGCNNTFEDGVSGISFEAKNVLSLVNAVNKFLALTYEQKRTMGINGRKKMEKEFDRTIVIKRYLNEINKLH